MIILNLVFLGLATENVFGDLSPLNPDNINRVLVNLKPVKHNRSKQKYVVYREILEILYKNIRSSYDILNNYDFKYFEDLLNKKVIKKKYIYFNKVLIEGLRRSVEDFKKKSLEIMKKIIGMETDGGARKKLRGMDMDSFGKFLEEDVGEIEKDIHIYFTITDNLVQLNDKLENKEELEFDFYMIILAKD